MSFASSMLSAKRPAGLWDFSLPRRERYFPSPADWHSGYWGPGEIIAWSRILDDEEMLCVVNGHGTAARGADVIVDANLNRNPSGTDRPLTVVLNTQQAASSDPATYGGPHALGPKVPVQRHSSGTAFVETRDIAPSEVIALANHP
jgi:hypothetical protein